MRYHIPAVAAPLRQEPERAARQHAVVRAGAGVAGQRREREADVVVAAQVQLAVGAERDLARVRASPAR